MVITYVVTRRASVVDRATMVTADRDTLIRACQQTFDELGMRVHKQDLSKMIHWPGGFGRATKLAAFMTGTLESYYAFRFSSAGQQRLTSLDINIKVSYGRWFHGREKAQARIDCFLEKLQNVSAEHGIRFVSK